MTANTNTQGKSTETDTVLTRRRLLTTTAVGAAGGVAGCTGNGGNGSNGGGNGGTTSGATSDGNGGSGSTLSFVAGPSDSLAFSMGNGLASVVRDNSAYTLDVKSGTSSQGVTLVGRGEEDISFSTTLVGTQASNGTGAFEGTEFPNTILQLPSYYFMRLGGFVNVDSDIEYFSDLAGESFGPGPSGTSYWPVFQRALEHAVDMDELDVQYSSVSRLPDLISSGQATSVGGPTLSNNVIPGFTQQVISQSDVRMLSYRDEAIQAIRDDSALPLVDVDKERLSNVAEFTASEGDTVPMVSANYVAWTSDAVAEETIYDIYMSAWENRDALSEVHAAFDVWGSAEWYTQNMTTEAPVHPGAAQFLQEIGAWNDDFTVGSV